MIGIRRAWTSILVALPMALLLGLAALPVLFLLAQYSGSAGAMEWSSLESTIRFAVGGAAISTIVGGAIGILAGIREFAGRKWLVVLSVVPVAAPPAFWWIGASRVTPSWINLAGPNAAALVGGLALAPVTLLLVTATIRQLPSNVYQAARVALPPMVRISAILLALLRSSLAGGFILTVILLLGESELPFLFGFRTLMTDVVTTFSQSFNVAKTLPLVIPLLLVILALGFMIGRPLIRTIMRSSRGTHGLIRKPAPLVLGLCAAVPAGSLLLSLGGYFWPIIAALPNGWPRLPIDSFTVAVSVIEPVASAWSALLLTLVTAYPARRSHAMAYFLWISLLLFCVPAAIYAIGWIEVGARLGGIAVPPIVAHTSRAVALTTLGFAVGYSRLPTSLEDAATLVRVSGIRRAFAFVLPLIGSSLLASSVLVAALTYADRDVASLLLPPGAARLTLNLYLASANARSSTVGVLAFAVLIGAALTVVLAATGPIVLWRRRG